MHEEANSGVWQLRAEQTREKHEVVIVDPNDVAFLVSRDDSISKSLVHCNILFE